MSVRMVRQNTKVIRRSAKLDLTFTFTNVDLRCKTVVISSEHCCYTALTRRMCFYVRSGAPSYPPMMAQQLMSNPMMTTAAMHYGQELTSRGQAVVEQNVRGQTLLKQGFPTR